MLGVYFCALSSKAKANTCISVSDKKKESPTRLADSLAKLQKFSEGVLTFTFPLSIAVVNRNHVIELPLISSSTLGTVNWFSPTEKGSNPARKADVSKTRTLSYKWSLLIFYPIPLNNNLLRRRR
jgi:hypothetical protein